MTNKTSIVIAGDSNIFPLTIGCLLSISVLRKKDIAINFIDTGCTIDQLERIKILVDRIIRFSDDLAVLPKGEVRPYWRAMACRPFIHKYFPEYEIYFWLDSDLWFQNPFIILDLIKDVEKFGSVIVSEFYEGYDTFQDAIKSKNYYIQKKKFTNIYKGKITLLDGEAYYNSGFLGVAKKSGLFDEFGKILRILYDVSFNHMTEQIAFNEVLFKTKLFSSISPVNNWMCNLGLPNFKDGVFLDPSNDKSKINVMHLSGKNKLKKYSKMLFNNGKYLEDIKTMICNDGFFV
jgi:lipopolysaccharide biosynthesis glycosyltransferase